MRHQGAGKRLNKSMGHRTALRKNLMKDLFQHERIKTTKAKAAAVRGGAEKLITLAKKGNAAGEAKAVHARRLVAARLNNPEMVMKLFDDIAPRYVDRQGGYTRVIKLGRRTGDAAEMVILELVEE